MVVYPVDINETRNLLPHIGERRMEIPSIQDGIETAVPQKCVVVEVSAKGLWYQMRFDNGGRCECYKVPRLKRRNANNGGCNW